MTKATDAIARVLSESRIDDTATIADPYEDATHEDIESRHAAKIRKDQREHKMRYGVVSMYPTGPIVEEMGMDEARRLGEIDEGALSTYGYTRIGLRVIFAIPGAPVDIEAMHAELLAVHSELGDASQTVFDLLESLAGREGKIAKLTATVTALESRITELKTQLGRAKEVAGPML